MFVSVTRLRVRRLWFFPGFVLHTLRSKKQVTTSPGFAVGCFARQSGLVFWTITLWHDQPAMLAFRNTGNHGRAMRHLMSWCDEASYVHWSQDNSNLPSAQEIFSRMRDQGKLSKVRHPSPEHAQGQTAGKTEPQLVGEFSTANITPA